MDNREKNSNMRSLFLSDVFMDEPLSDREVPNILRVRHALRTCRLFSRGVIFTRPRVSLALLSLRKNGGLLVVYVFILNLLREA